MTTRGGWHRALDVQLDTHKWGQTDRGASYNYSFMLSMFSDSADLIDEKELLPTYTEFCLEMEQHFQITLWRGDTIYITADMLHVIMQAAEDLPEELEFDPKTLMSQYGFALFEEAILGKDANGETLSVTGIAWECNPVRPEFDIEGIEPGDLKMASIIYFLTDPHDLRDDVNERFKHQLGRANMPLPPLTLSHVFPLLEGQGAPDGSLPGMGLVTDIVKLFLAMQILSRQTIGEPQRFRPDRAQRRRIQREYPEQPERLITLITLRRKSAKHNEEPQKIEWSRRWIVRGHWRKQYYPKTKTYDWKYIYEYVKGPEDKPLVTGRRVFDFRR
jgi:hypothetical protein